MNLKFIFISLLLVITSTVYCQSNYYWYKSNKIYLTTDSSISYLQLKKSSVSLTNKSAIAVALKVNDTLINQLSDSEFIIKSKLNLSTVFQQINLRYAAPLLMNKSSTMIVLPRIVVELKLGHTIKEILNLYKAKLSFVKDKGFNTYIEAV